VDNFRQLARRAARSGGPLPVAFEHRPDESVAQGLS